MLGLNGYRKGFELVKDVIINGGPSFINFALTNACNARCSFCTFPKIAARDRVYVDTAKAKEALDILYRRGVRWITFVGGEPLLHPDFLEIVRYSKDKGIVCMMSTNATFLGEEIVCRLKEAGLSIIFISIDAATVEEHEKNRGLPGVCETVRRAIPKIKAEGMNCIASVTISKLIKDYSKLVIFLRDLGFEKMTFSNPMIRYSDSYAGYTNSGLIDYRPQEIIEVFRTIKRLKSRFRILNPTASLEDMVRFFNDGKVRFTCLGGYKSFYLDWLLDVYPCQTLNEKMGTIYEFDKVTFKRLNCNLCINECYREPSLMQYVAISVSDAVASFSNGSVIEGLRRLWDINNLVSLWASVEEWKDGGRI